MIDDMLDENEIFSVEVEVELLLYDEMVVEITMGLDNHEPEVTEQLILLQEVQ